MKFIGISGNDGSGKDSLGEYLRDEHGWIFISVTDLLREEAKKRGIELGRDTLRQISAEWRRQSGLGVLVDKAFETHKLSGSKKNLVIASLRNPGEADRVHDLGGVVVWVSADPLVRYNRIISRNRGAEDHVTLEEFKAEEKAQSQYSGDEATLNLNAVKEKADVDIDNSGSDMSEFKIQIKKTLKEYI